MSSKLIGSVGESIMKITFVIRILTFSAFLAFLHYEIKLANLARTDPNENVASSRKKEPKFDPPPILKEFELFQNSELSRELGLKIPKDVPVNVAILRQQVESRVRNSARQEMKSVNFGNRTAKDLLLGQGGKPIRTLIVGTWRSGSSFLGQVLRSHPATYYIYEPLAPLCACSIRNGTLLAEQAIDTLRKLYHCKYDDLGDGYIDGLMNRPDHRSESKRLWKFCLTTRGVCQDALFLSSTCKEYPVQAFKSVRLRLDVAQELLADTRLNLKMLYLVRDPRATIHSRLPHEWCLRHRDCVDPSRLCGDMASEYYLSRHLQQQYPTRFMTVMYEALTADIFNMTERIFKFLELEFHVEVQTFLKSHTKSNAGNAYSTFRDTKAAANHWLHDWAKGFNVISSIQNSCVEAMNLWGYKNMTEHDLAKMTHKA